MSNICGRKITLPLAALVGMIIGAVPAAPALAATWPVVATPNASTGQNLFIGVDALSTNNVWAVGYRYDPTLAQLRTLALRTING